MSTAIAPNHHQPTTIHDPFSPHNTTHYSPNETAALLDLLAVDILIDSRSPPPIEHTLLNELLAVDLEFSRATDTRSHRNIATAPELKEDKDVFLDLLKTDLEVDGANGKMTSPSGCSSSDNDQHYASSKALHDPYVKKEYTTIEASFAPGMLYNNKKEDDQIVLRDNATMMHLLAMDESVDDSKRYQKLIASDDYAIIGELYDVDREVSGAKRRALLVEDLQGLLDVDHLVDGVTKADGGAGAGEGGGGKRSIFSVKEKYTAKVASSK
ncbi:hypothetical protein ACHAXR_006163 [Thalassiosira sp. AJA248-18]